MKFFLDLDLPSRNYDNKEALAPCMQLENGHNGLPVGTQSDSHIVIRSDKKGIEIF